MIKTNLALLLIFITCIFSFDKVEGQRYSKDFLTHKIIVNNDKGSVVAYVKPVKPIPVQSDQQYYWFSGNQVNSTQGGYSGKLLNGGYQEFYLNKSLKESGLFSKGVKTGIWKNWTESGQLKADYTWNFGKKNGIYHTYDSLGRLAETGKYRNGLLNGRQKKVVADSIQVVYYKKGKVTTPKSIIPGFIRRIFS